MKQKKISPAGIQDSYFVFLCMLIFVLFPQSACENKTLGRKKAAELIENHEQFKNHQTMEPVTIITGTQKMIYRESTAPVNTLSKTGYLQVARNGRSPSGYDLWDVSLTSKGKAVLRCNSADLCTGELGKRQFVDVTGIFVQGPQVTVDYSWTWNLTSLGKDLAQFGLGLPGGIQKGKALFHLYDDGWRLESLTPEGYE